MVREAGPDLRKPKRAAGASGGRKDGGPSAFDCSCVFGPATFTMAGPTLLLFVSPAVCCLPTREEAAPCLRKPPHATRRRQPVWLWLGERPPPQDPTTLTVPALVVAVGSPEADRFENASGSEPLSGVDRLLSVGRGLSSSLNLLFRVRKRPDCCLKLSAFWVQAPSHLPNHARQESSPNWAPALSSCCSLCKAC